MAKPVRSDHVDTYGPWAWVAGIAFAGLVTSVSYTHLTLPTTPYV